MRAAWMLFATAALAGCLAGEADDGETTLDAMRAIGEPTGVLHDHNDVHLHTGSHNLDFVGWSPLDVTLGDNGFANFVLHEDGDRLLAFVAVDGDSEGGFTIADVTDPAAIEVLGHYRGSGSGFQEVRVTPDGQYAVLNVQDIPDPAQVPARGLSACSVCIHVVDVSDPSAPSLVSITPVELLGTHNFHFEQYDDGLYLFAVGQPLGVPVADVGNHIWVYRFTEVAGGLAVLVPVASVQHDYLMDDGRTFPHDVLVQDHPDGRKVAYISHWDGGHVTFDVTDPLLPMPLGVYADAAPSDVLAVHWFMQEQRAREHGAWAGNTIAWSAPEIGGLDTGSGVIRAIDVTDPAAMSQLGTWDLPGDVTIEDAPYIFSPHTAIPDMERGLLAVAHYHAGVWVLDITDPSEPRHTAFYEPHGDPEDPYDGPIWWKKPNFDPDGYGPNAYQARWHEAAGGEHEGEQLLWVTDRGTGLYALRYTGPVPGPL